MKICGIVPPCRQAGGPEQEIRGQATQPLNSKSLGAAVIEFTQTLIPTRHAGIIDIVIAALGAGTGNAVCAALDKPTP
ncbi:MAG: hypothetical protein ABSH28_09430 [Acidobacteriota bacterium]|jgi:hypothetical protein